AGCHLRGDSAQQFLPGVGQTGGEEECGDEVEVASGLVAARCRLGFPGRDVADGELRVDSAGFSGRAGTVDGRCRQVDAGDVPAVLGQPDGVGALSAADVEDAAGGHLGNGGHEGLVRVARPYGVLGLRVALLPGRDGVRHSLGRILCCFLRGVVVHCSVPGSAGIESGELASVSGPAASCLASSARTSSMSRPLTAVMTCSSWGAASAPGWAKMTNTWRRATRVWIDEYANRPASCCWASVSMLPKTMSGLASAACSYTGANCLHGPHQSAQKSRRMISLSLMVDSKLSCVISIVDMRASLGGADECSLDSGEQGVMLPGCLIAAVPAAGRHRRRSRATGRR